MSVADLVVGGGRKGRRAAPTARVKAIAARAARPMASAARGDAAPNPGKTPLAPREWIPAFEEFCTEVTAEEFGRAFRRAARDIRGGMRGTRAGEAPVFLVLFGSPGSGKTTIVDGVAEAAGLRVGRKYVVVDYDALDAYYPRYEDLMNVPGFVARKRLGVGFAHAHMCEHLNNFTIALGDALVEDFVAARLNMAVVSHRPSFLVQARLSGYRSVFVYVGAPMETVVARAHQRAINTGFLLAPTLAAQDTYVQGLWEEYVRLAPWYALWSDLFIAVDNGPHLEGSAAGRAAREMSIYDLGKRRGDPGLEPILTELYRRVSVASGLPADHTPLPSLPAVSSFLLSTAGISPQGASATRRISAAMVPHAPGQKAPSKKYRVGSRGAVRGGQAEQSGRWHSDAAGALAALPLETGTTVWGVYRDGRRRYTSAALWDGEGLPASALDVNSPATVGEPLELAALVFDRTGGDEKDADLPPTGREIATALAFAGGVFSLHFGGWWSVLPTTWSHTPCLASARCLRLLTVMPWAERLAAWDVLEDAGGARLRETYPVKARDMGFAAKWVERA